MSFALFYAYITLGFLGLPGPRGVSRLRANGRRHWAAVPFGDGLRRLGRGQRLHCALPPGEAVAADGQPQRVLRLVGIYGLGLRLAPRGSGEKNPMLERKSM